MSVFMSVCVYTELKYLCIYIGVHIKLIDLDTSDVFTEHTVSKWSSAYLPPSTQFTCFTGVLLVTLYKY
jgi:hypothetical protein